MRLRDYQTEIESEGSALKSISKNVAGCWKTSQRTGVTNRTQQCISGGLCGEHTEVEGMYLFVSNGKTEDHVSVKGSIEWGDVPGKAVASHAGDLHGRDLVQPGIGHQNAQRGVALRAHFSANLALADRLERIEKSRTFPCPRNDSPLLVEHVPKGIGHDQSAHMYAAVSADHARAQAGLGC